jgi:hypothetical protein
MPLAGLERNSTRTKGLQRLKEFQLPWSWLSCVFLPSEERQRLSWSSSRKFPTARQVPA